ncbi:hypothetical protein [Nostoc sp.]|uniref:hypothetical protein n=1 Tax=Nostoc sp. TaxID=1180 RepID=UPI002FFA61AF
MYDNITLSKLCNTKLCNPTAPQRLTVCVAPGASTHATAFMPRRGHTLKITHEPSAANELTAS